MIEVERGYRLNETDYEIIKNNFEKVGEKHIYDEYYDDDGYTLMKWSFYIRNRNGDWDLKIPVKEERPCDTYHEVEGKEEVKKALADLGYDFDNHNIAHLIIDKSREKFKTTFAWKDIAIDVDKCDAGHIYEIELMVEDVSDIEEGYKIMENFRNEYGLTWERAKVNIFLEASKRQVPELYDYFIENSIFESCVWSEN